MDVSNCAGGRCNVSNQSVQTEANVITEQEYAVLMNAVVARAETVPGAGAVFVTSAKRCH